MKFQVSSLDINIWHRWMHTHRINVILNHDTPLPKNFVLPNESGRFIPVQCRKASAKVTDMLIEVINNAKTINLLLNINDFFLFRRAPLFWWKILPTLLISEMRIKLRLSALRE